MHKDAQIGQFSRDASGVWHYSHKRFGLVHDAIENALRTRPRAPCWFWFNGTPAPMFAGDTTDAILQRWNGWRDAYQAGGDALLNKLQGLDPSVSTEG